MKKTSTLALSMLLAAGAWCGLAYAAEGDAPAAEQQTATFDFTTNDYDLELLSGSTQVYATEWTATEGDVTITLDKGEGNGVRLWDAKGGHELRLYKKSALDVTIEDNGTVESIQLIGTNALTNVKVNGAAATSTENSNKTAVYTVGAEKATITTTDNVYFSQIIVNYTPGKVDDRKEPQLTTNVQPEYTVVMGETWYPPYISVNPWDIELNYTSSNLEVVSFNDWGMPIIVGPGEATITATTVETDEYKSVSLSYKVIVLPEGTVFSSKLGEGFELASPWVVDAKYGLKATGYVNKTNTETKGMAVSSEFAITKSSSATLTFESAVNYLYGAVAADYCKLYIAIVGNANEQGTGGYYDGEEETADEINWIPLDIEIATPAEAGFTFEPYTLDLGTEFADKKVKIAFEYTSTTEVACTWEVKNISVVCTDLLKPLKEAAYEEVCKYGELLGDRINEWMLNGWKQTIYGCESEAQIEDAKEYIFQQITGTIYSSMEMNFTWNVGDDKVASYVADAAEGTSPWQATDFNMNALFTCQRVNTPGMTPFAADAKAAEPSEDAFTIKNSKTGLYVAAPTEVGAPVGATDNVDEAGIFVLKCTEGVITVADDASGKFIAFDATKGMILSETPQMISTDELTTWDKEETYHVTAEFPGAEQQGWEKVIDEISVIKVAVSTEAVVSGIGGIELEYLDQNWDRHIVLSIPAASLEGITPEKGEGYTTEWEAGQQVQIPYEANVYTIALREKLTEAGIYNITVQEGTFMVETAEGRIFSPEAYESVTIYSSGTGEEGFAPIVTPEAGIVEQLDKFVIDAPEWSEDGILGINFSTATEAKITLASATEIIAEWDKNQIDDANTRDINDFSAPDRYELVLDTPVTENGEYVLTIEPEIFEDSFFAANGLTEITYSVENGQVSIKDITVNGTSVIYDLQGRRINSNARGIVISNGKKILVK